MQIGDPFVACKALSHGEQVRRQHHDACADKCDLKWLALGEEHLQHISKILPDNADMLTHLLVIVPLDSILRPYHDGQAKAMPCQGQEDSYADSLPGRMCSTFFVEDTRKLAGACWGVLRSKRGKEGGLGDGGMGGELPSSQEAIALLADGDEGHLGSSKAVKVRSAMCTKPNNGSATSLSMANGCVGGQMLTCSQSTDPVRRMGVQAQGTSWGHAGALAENKPIVGQRQMLLRLQAPKPY